MQSLWMAVAAVFYAFYGAFVKLAGIEHISSWEVLFYRSVAGLIVFGILMYRKGIPLANRHPWAHLTRSVAGTCSIIAGIYSISHLNLGLAMTLNYTAPLFLGAFVIVYSLLRHARINWGLILSLVFGFVGVVTLLGPTIGPEEYFPAVVGVSAGLTAALATGFVKRLGAWREPESRIIFYLMFAGTVTGIAGICLTNGFTAWTWTRFCWIVLLSLTAIMGQLTLTMAFSRGNIALCGALQYLAIVFSSILGMFFFGDSFTVEMTVGMIIIVFAGISASWFTKKEQTATGTRLPTKH